MNPLLDLRSDLLPVTEFLADRLADVSRRFDEQLRSDLPPVSDLVRHVERYRGKMLRPTLVLLCGIASHPGASRKTLAELISSHHITTAAVCEMVHMATLVHDDVLDDADVRRRGATVNRLHGNEAAVILGDYLIASAYHLCSQIGGEAGNHSSLAIGRASMVMCSGELLQLHHREHYSLDEETYFEIVDRKTAELIATACELGAFHSGASKSVCEAMRAFGRKLGIAFQIQDDLLDLLGSEAVVGKSVGKDLEKGKMTLPVIHHLGAADASTRGRTLRLIESAVACDGKENGVSREATRSMLAALNTTQSVARAREVAAELVAEAKAAIAGLSETPAKGVLLAMADAVISRAF